MGFKLTTTPTTVIEFDYSDVIELTYPAMAEHYCPVNQCYILTTEQYDRLCDSFLGDRVNKIFSREEFQEYLSFLEKPIIPILEATGTLLKVTPKGIEDAYKKIWSTDNIKLFRYLKRGNNK